MVVFLKKWIESVAITVIIASIIEMILPSGNLKKYIKAVLGIYILFSIISPFVNSKKLYSFDIEKEINNYLPKIQDNYNNNFNNKDITKKVDNNLEKVYTKVFEEKLTNLIIKYGFNLRSVLIDASFDSTKDDIGIKKITIVLSSKNSNFKNEENKENIEKKDDKINNKIEIRQIEEVNIVVNENTSKNDNKNIKEKDESIKIESKDIDELKKYLSEYFDIKEDIFEIKAY